jgi:hypothetical protein
MTTIDELIQQGEGFTSRIKYIPPLSNTIRSTPVYHIANAEEYGTWKATAKRFIGVNYPDDKAVEEFEQTAKNRLSLGNHRHLLAILKAIKTIPQPNTVPMDSDKKSGDIIVNNSNTVNQTQNTTVQYAFFIESIRNELTGRQFQEIKDIIDQHKDSPETARPKIIEKLMSFGSNVAASILGNLMTNPNIYAGF